MPLNPDVVFPAACKDFSLEIPCPNRLPTQQVMSTFLGGETLGDGPIRPFFAFEPLFLSDRLFLSFGFPVVVLKSADVAIARSCHP